MKAIEFFEIDGKAALSKAEYNEMCDRINIFLAGRKVSEDNKDHGEQKFIISELRNVVAKLREGNVLILDIAHLPGSLSLASFTALLSSMKIEESVLSEIFAE